MAGCAGVDGHVTPYEVNRSMLAVTRGLGLRGVQRARHVRCQLRSALLGFERERPGQHIARNRRTCVRASSSERWKATNKKTDTQDVRLLHRIERSSDSRDFSASVQLSSHVQRSTASHDHTITKHSPATGLAFSHVRAPLPSVGLTAPRTQGREGGFVVGHAALPWKQAGEVDRS